MTANYGKSRAFKNNNSSSGSRSKKSQKAKANNNFYKQLVEKAKLSNECHGLTSEDFSYSCVTYMISPTCFREHIGTYGMEFGEESS